MSADAAGPRFCANDVVSPAIASRSAVRREINARVYMTVTLLRSFVVDTRPQVPAGDGAIRPPILAQTSQPNGRRRKTKLICSLDGLHNAKVPDRQHIRPVQTEHQE